MSVHIVKIFRLIKGKYYITNKIIKKSRREGKFCTKMFLRGGEPVFGAWHGVSNTR